MRGVCVFQLQMRDIFISEAVRGIFPGVLSGLYAPEEVGEFTPVQAITEPEPLQIEAPKEPEPLPESEPEAEGAGQAFPGEPV